MGKLEITKSGIVIPKTTPGVRCGFCPKIIWKDNEPKGRLSLLAGKPICVVCRLKRGKNWKQIDADVKKKQPEDMKRIEKIRQDNADQNAEAVAITTRSPKTALKK